MCILSGSSSNTSNGHTRRQALLLDQVKGRGGGRGQRLPVVVEKPGRRVDPEREIHLNNDGGNKNHGELSASTGPHL